MPKCRDCSWARRTDTGNPLERNCLANRKTLEEGEAMSTLMAGKVVKADDEACELFQDKSKDVDKKHFDS